MPLAILVIPSIICALYGLYRGLKYASDSFKDKIKEKRGDGWD